MGWGDTTMSISSTTSFSPFRSLASFAFAALLGCGSTVYVDGDGQGGNDDDGPPPPPPGVGGSGLGGVGGDGGVPSTGGGGDGGDPPEGGSGAGGPVDCAAAPTTAISTQILPGARGYHGLAIDENGLIWGLDQGGTLRRSTYDGSWTPFVSNLWAEQIAFAPDGDLHMASFGTILTVTPSAQLQTLNGQVGGYGLRMGPDGKVWVADSDGVRRVDPTTGAAEVVSLMPPAEDGGFGSQAHSFDFNRSFTRLVVGTIGSEGQIRAVDLDENFNALGDLEPYVDVEPFGSVWIDGIAFDACGNFYAPNYSSSQLFKVTPDGQSSVFVDWSFNSSHYGHGVIFGNDKFGFRQDALYLPMPYNANTVMEVVVGIPGREYEGEVLNGPTP
jgi:streptogramin lyase